MQKPSIAIKIDYCPALVSINWEPVKDTYDQWVEMFRAIQLLPFEIQRGLLHEKTREAVFLLTKKYKISNEKQAAEIARIIRDYYLMQTKDAEMVKRVQAKIQLPSGQFNLFMEDLIQIIKFVKQVGINDIKKEVEKITIIEALKKYEKLGNQQVTNKLLNLKMFIHPAKPTIKNWLEDYFSRMGTDKHNSMQRSDYLFNSENGKNISFSERNKLAIILKSYDNNEMVLVHKNDQEVVFTEAASIEDKSIETEVAANMVKEANAKTSKLNPKDTISPSQSSETVDLSGMKDKGKTAVDEKNVVDLSKYL